MNKKALICGVSGQDGAYLAKLLLNKGYEVWGTSRDAQGSNFKNLKELKIFNEIKMISMVPEDFRSVILALKKSCPDEIYYLAGQSSVGLSFELPAETIQSISFGTLNILEACRMMGGDIKQYYAGSSECFGDTGEMLANEKTQFNPKSPYAVAKASSYWLVENYREAYGLYACSGILFNHESILRPERFVTQKIISTVKRISEGSKERLVLGRTDIIRDWGWAPEYVEAMWLMLQQNKAEDFVICTGKSIALQEFIDIAFKYVGLNAADYLSQNNDFIRPADILISQGDPSKANKKLGWASTKKVDQVIKSMMNLE